MEEGQKEGRVLYQAPDYKEPEKKEPYSVRLTPTTKKQIADLAKGLGKSEAEIIAGAIFRMLHDQPTIEQRAQEVRTVIDQQCNELYWTYQDPDTMPVAEHGFYQHLMRIDGELEQYIPQVADEDDTETKQL